MKKSPKYSAIEVNFNSAKNYNQKASVQEQIANELLQTLPKTNYKNVLELGAGYGLLTSKIKSNIEFENMWVNDLIDCDNVNLPGNMLEIDLPGCDLVISSSALHWLEDDLSRMFDKISHSQTKGFFVFSTFVHGTLPELQELNVPLKYHTQEQLATMIAKDYKIISSSTKTIKKTFNSPREVLLEFKDTGTKISGIDLAKIRNFKKKTLTYKYSIFVCKKD